MSDTFTFDVAPRDSVKQVGLNGAQQQRRRREDTLCRQKARRAAQLAQSRAVPSAEDSGTENAPAIFAPPEAAAADAAAAATNSAMDDAMAPLPTAESSMDTSGSSSSSFGKRRGPADALMSAEWMVDVPSDLGHNWYVAPRPSGRRCLVVTSNGSTKAHGRSGKPRTFPSALPSGSRATRSGLCACELDCIFSEAEQTYHILDVLSWKDQRLVDCPSDFRLWWLASKLAECTAHVASSANPCRFIVLPYMQCTPEALLHAYSGPPPFASARDGLSLLHREALYEAGPSPLLLSWSDASCSSRFYDYGSEKMAKAIGADPSRASKWRTDELDAACGFEALMLAAEQPPMEMTAEDDVEPAPRPAPVAAAPAGAQPKASTAETSMMEEEVSLS